MKFWQIIRNKIIHFLFYNVFYVKTLERLEFEAQYPQYRNFDYEIVVCRKGAGKYWRK